MNTVEGANRIDLASNIRGADMTTGACPGLYWIWCLELLDNEVFIVGK